MADGVTITQGTGTTIAADEIASVKYQRVKLVLGADGTNDGDVCTALPMPISDADGAITVDGTVAVTNADLTTIAGDTTSIDGKITACNTGAVVISSGAVTETNSAAIKTALETAGGLVVNLGANNDVTVTGSITADLGANNDVTVTNATAANLKCEEASASAIKTAVEVLDNCISGSEAQVDIVAALPTGTNTIGAVKRDVINYTAVRKYYTYSGAVTDGIVWSPAAGKKWVITDLIINTSAAAVVTLEEDLSAGDSAFMKFELAANGGVSTNFQTPLMSTEDDADLLVTTSAGNIYITVSGYEIE